MTFPRAFTLYAQYRYDAPTHDALFSAFALYVVRRDDLSRGVHVPTAIHCGATCATLNF